MDIDRDYNKEHQSFLAYNPTWLDHWDVISGVQIGVFSVVFLIGLWIVVGSRASRLLISRDKKVLIFDLFMFTASQVATGILMLIFIKDGEKSSVGRGATFTSLSGTYCLEVYLMYVIDLPFMDKLKCTAWPRTLSLALMIGGFIVSTVGIFGREILFKIGVFLMLGANIGLSIMAGVLNARYCGKTKRSDYTYVVVATSLMSANIVYYINLVFQYKVYLFQLHYGVYIGLDMVIKFLVLALVQVFLFQWKRPSPVYDDSESDKIDSY